MASMTSLGTGTNTTDITIASHTITGDRLGVLAWAATANGGTNPTLPTPSGHGTWTVIQNVPFTDGVTQSCRFALWYFMPNGSDSTASLTLAEGATAWAYAAARVAEVDDAVPTTGSPRGADAVVQSAQSNTDGSSTAESVTLSAFGAGTNLCINACSVFIDGTIPSIALDDSQAFTELGDLAGTFNVSFDIGYYTGQDTSPGGSWTSVDASAAIGVEVEINAAGGGGVIGIGARAHMMRTFQ